MLLFWAKTGIGWFFSLSYLLVLDDWKKQNTWPKEFYPVMSLNWIRWSRFSLSDDEEGKKRRGWWLVSRVATGSGFPHTVLTLTLELLCPGIPVSLTPGHAGHPTPAGPALPTECELSRDKLGVFLEAGGRSSPAVSPWEARLQSSGISSNTACWPSPRAGPCVRPVPRASGAGAVPCRRVRSCPCRSRQGCVRQPRACSWGWLSTSIHLLWTDRLPSLPVLHLHIRHLLFWTSPFITLTGVPPINFPASLVIQTCLELQRFFQHSGWEL